MSSEVEPLDRIYIKENYLDVGFRDLLVDILSLFGQQADIYIASIQEALARQDMVALAEQAHALKGSAGSVGACAISATALDLERAASNGDLEKSASLVSSLIMITSSTNAAITSELEKLAHEDNLNLL